MALDRIAINEQWFAQLKYDNSEGNHAVIKIKSDWCSGNVNPTDQVDQTENYLN